MNSLYFRNSLLVSILLFAFSTLFARGADTKRKVLELKPGDDLPRFIGSAKSGTTIVLKDGLYKLTRPIVILKDDVWIRSASGNRHKVILDGQKGKGKLKRANCINEILAIKASSVKISGISVCHARDHGIHISPQAVTHVKDVHLHNIHVYDCGQQLIKVNSNGKEPLYWTDNCILEDSLIEFTDNSIMHDMGRYFYTGGIDVHGGQNWKIRRNVFRNIQREGKTMEHAVHMWSKCRATLVEGNHFINCYRAVGFGMKVEPKGLIRKYPDGKGNKPFFDHVGGIVRNNFIFNTKGIHLESGIELMNVIDVKVYHNTVISQDKPFSSIEYRWPNTRVEIINNLVSHNIKQRNGARAILKGNIENARRNIFKNYKKGDLHLAATATSAINRGVAIKDFALKGDIDGNRRDEKPDIGADELNR